MGQQLLVFSNSGWIVHHPDPERDVDYNTRGAGPHGDGEEFQGRRPVLADPDTRNLYVGEENWYHGDTATHHGVGDKDYWTWHEGYFNGGPNWGNGALQWYGAADGPPHQEIAQALTEAGYPIPNPDTPRPDNGLLDDSAFDDSEIWGDDSEIWNPHTGSKDDFGKWWKKKSPITKTKAAILAEYAKGEKLDREDAKRYIDEHESEIIGDSDDFRRRFFRKFDAL